MGFPIILKEKLPYVRPKDKMFYLLTSSGLFKCRNHELFQSDVICVTPFTRRTEGDHWYDKKSDQPGFPGHLQPHQEQCKVLIQLPADVLGKAVRFFLDVFNRYFSESIVQLLWHPQEKKYDLIVPKQRVSGGSLHYDPVTPPDGWLVVGDIHCHGHDTAYSSGTDHRDEQGRDGIHIIVGDADRPELTWAISYSVDNIPFKILDLSPIASYSGPAPHVPDEWMAQVTYETFRSFGHRDDFGYSKKTEGEVRSAQPAGVVEPGSWFRRFRVRPGSRIWRFLYRTRECIDRWIGPATPDLACAAAEQPESDWVREGYFRHTT